jgi:putative PIN family toxin of toxin-antitoxin system
MKVERVVLDTNVLISAALVPQGKPSACLSWVLENATLVSSLELLQELETRLARPKFNKYLDDALRKTFVADVAANTAIVKVRGVIRLL